MSQEIIYTSAPKGLKLGSRGFCTVAGTPGMAKNLAERLESFSGYRHLYPPQDPQARLNPVVHSFLATNVGGMRYCILSRIADAGLDYSQRTNKLAHHVALTGGELPDAGPAWVLSQPGFSETAWSGEPRMLQGRAAPRGELAPRVCQAWQQQTGDAGWAGVLAQTVADGRSEAYLIFRPGMELLPLLVEAQALLPPQLRWRATFSTYFTKLPPGGECRWRCVVAGTPEATAARRARAATLIDLTAPPGPAPNGPLVEAARTGAAPPIAAPPAPEAAPPAASTLPHETEDEIALAPPPPHAPPTGPPSLSGGPPRLTREPISFARKPKRKSWRLSVLIPLGLLLGGAGAWGGRAAWRWYQNPAVAVAPTHEKPRGKTVYIPRPTVGPPEPLDPPTIADDQSELDQNPTAPSPPPDPTPAGDVPAMPEENGPDSPMPPDSPPNDPPPAVPAPEQPRRLADPFQWLPKRGLDLPDKGKKGSALGTLGGSENRVKPQWALGADPSIVTIKLHPNDKAALVHIGEARPAESGGKIWPVMAGEKKIAKFTVEPARDENFYAKPSEEGSPLLKFDWEKGVESKLETALRQSLLLIHVDETRKPALAPLTKLVALTEHEPKKAIGFDISRLDGFTERLDIAAVPKQQLQFILDRVDFGAIEVDPNSYNKKPVKHAAIKFGGKANLCCDIALNHLGTGKHNLTLQLVKVGGPELRQKFAAWKNQFIRDNILDENELAGIEDRIDRLSKTKDAASKTNVKELREKLRKNKLAKAVRAMQQQLIDHAKIHLRVLRVVKDEEFGDLSAVLATYGDGPDAARETEP